MHVLKHQFHERQQQEHHHKTPEESVAENILEGLQRGYSGLRARSLATALKVFAQKENNHCRHSGKQTAERQNSGMRRHQAFSNDRQIH